MAIEFARARALSRRKGGSAVRTAAYNSRSIIRSERTGERYAFEDHGTLVHHDVLLPAGAPRLFSDPALLWNAAELVERRKDSVVGREIVLALPADAALSHEDRVALVRDFVQVHWVSKGVPVQIDIHAPHATGRAPAETVNFHAHVLIATRRLGPDGFNPRKAFDLDPQHRTVGGRRIVAEAEQWGSTWREFQDNWLSQHGKTVRVDPRLPHPTEHLGPRRFRHPLDPRLQTARLRQQLNAAALVAIDRVPSGWREIEITDIARELSPQYAALTQRRVELLALSRKADALREKRKGQIVQADALLAERRWRIGRIRAVLHTTGAHEDIETRELHKYRKRAERGVERWSIRAKTYADQLTVITRQAVEELDRIRPEAMRELRRRQKIAQDARNTLESLARHAVYPRRSRRRGRAPA